MRGLIAFFVKNPVWIRVILIAVFIFGFLSLSLLKSSFFAPIDPKTISVSAVYPGASPEEVETGIVLKIENNLANISGVDRITAQASENLASLTIEIADGYNGDDVLEDVKNAIDRVASFPPGMEPPIVVRNEIIDRAIDVVLTGPESIKVLKQTAEQIEDDLRQSGLISTITLSGFPEEEIEIAVSETKLQAYNLDINTIGQAIQAANIEITGGTIKTPAESFIIRANKKAFYAKDLADIIIKTTPAGALIRLSDIATLRDTWADTPVDVFLNKQRAVIINIQKTPDQDIFDIVTFVRNYITEFNQNNTDIQATISNDASVVLKQRIALLSNNGLIGFILVLLILGLFLNVGVAFWVALSIPVCFMGLFIVGSIIGLTINVISLFGMIIVVGILVDDGIVIAENIYQKIESGVNRFDAAVDGTLEVLPSVTASIITTIIAFMPFFFIKGRISDILGDMAVVVIITLAISLIDGIIILPSHIAHVSIPKKQNRFKVKFNQFFDAIRYHYYPKALKLAMNNTAITLALPVCLLAITITLVRTGDIPVTFFPFIDSDSITIQVKLPPGSNESRTLYWLDYIDNKVIDTNAQFQSERADKKSVVIDRAYYLTNAHTGVVSIELLDGETRNMDSSVINQAIRQAVGVIDEAESVTFETRSFFGKPVDISLLGSNRERLAQAKERLKAGLEAIPALSDINEINATGLRDVSVSLNETAYFLGLTAQSVLNQVRNGIFGYEVQRVQRGSDTVKLWVRYTESERESLATLERMPIRTPSGEWVPLNTIASFSIDYGVLAINHLNGFREARITASLTNESDPVPPIIQQIQTELLAGIRADYPGISYTFGGQKRETDKTTQSARAVIAVLFFAMILVISLGFQSIVQALVVVLILPIGFIGVAWGHVVHGFSINILSGYGIIALTGITVNDSIVLINQFNRLIQSGSRVSQAISEAATSRFRPILLTSLTTISGLGPLVFEKSRQAQFLIPMAISVAYGLIVVTFVILFVIPVLLNLVNKAMCYIHWIKTGVWPASELVEPAYKQQQAIIALKQETL